MSKLHRRRLSLRTEIEKWPLIAPFRITGHTWEAVEVVRVSLERDGFVGYGEAAGVFYRGETPISMTQQIEVARATIESGIDFDALQKLLPPGGARNAVDCALWDLHSQLLERPVWKLAGLNEPQPLLTTFGCGADEPRKMAATAAGYTAARAIKLKLTGEPIDSDRVLAVRAARPDVWLGVDANQGLTRISLEQLMPALTAAGVALIEQPFRIGEEAMLDNFDSPIPIAADESFQSASDFVTLGGRFDVVNIKLDKCGGLTEGLSIARAALEHGFEVMVGNMLGTSLAMAPACLVGQLCGVVDLDGPIFLSADRESTVRYDDGLICCPQTLWGYGATARRPAARSSS